MVTQKEVAWRPAFAPLAIEWLAAHGYAVLGTELWLPKTESVQSLPYFQTIDREPDEPWALFVSRAAAETLAYLRASERMFSAEGDVYVNVTWINEADFQKLSRSSSG